MNKTIDFATISFNHKADHIMTNTFPFYCHRNFVLQTNG
jgi:hypothetical protein